MDSDKLEKLQDVKWRPAKSCGTCVNSKFAAGKEWGTCELNANTYFHNKHQRLHKLPAHKSAVCDYHCEDMLGPTVEELRGFLSSEVTS